MVTIETLTQAGMSEDEAKRILELYGAEGGEAAPEGEPEEAAEAQAADPKAAPDPDQPEEPTEDSEAPAADAEGEAPAEPEAPIEPEAPAEPEVPTEAPEEQPSEAPDYAAENAALRARLIASELRAAGLAAGVRPDRLSALARLADTSRVDAASESAPGQIAQAVADALKEVPELAAAPFAAGSLGAHLRDSSHPTDPFARGLNGK